MIPTDFIERYARTKLDQLLGMFPAVGILGPRQVGKTTLARWLGERMQKEVVYLDLESPEALAKLSEPELYLRNQQEKLVILDEIHQLPTLFPVLRSLIDSHRSAGRFLLLGSASMELLKQSSESLAGRITYVELSPFHIQEVSEAERLWFRGGFPLSYLATTDENARTWLQAFIATYVQRDLPMQGITLPPMRLRAFWEMIAHLQGQMWNSSKLAANFDLSVPTIKRYLSLLESTYLVRQLSPYATNLKKRLVKTPKVFIRDSGVLHALLRIPSLDALFSHPVVGASYEGWVIEQIRGHLFSEDVRLYFYRTHAGAEVDLLLDTGSERIPIEIKRSLSPKPSRGFHEAMNDLNCRRGYVVYPGTETYPLSPIVDAISLNQLLTHLKGL